jgi:Flp pilus assembly protein TadG
MTVRGAANRKRRGALLVEGAVVYPLVLILIFMLIIGGMGVFRYQQVACLAREGARWAAVRGSDWRKETGIPSPTKNDILQQAVLPLGVGMATNNIGIQVTWIDQVSGQSLDWDAAPKHPMSVIASNNQGVSNRVRVTVTYQWIPQLFVAGPITLSSTCEIPMSS